VTNPGNAAQQAAANNPGGAVLPTWDASQTPTPVQTARSAAKPTAHNPFLGPDAFAFV